MRSNMCWRGTVSLWSGIAVSSGKPRAEPCGWSLGRMNLSGPTQFALGVDGADCLLQAVAVDYDGDG